jgi:Sec-independent protein secretion pathway component TatC
MTPLYIHVRELKYRCLYVLFTLVTTLIVAWTYRYTLVHLYISNVTNTLYTIDIGEEMRIGVFISIYIALLSTLPYLSYTYFCYICPGIYTYEYTRNLYKYIIVSLYITFIYITAHLHIWPGIYNLLMGSYMGTEALWGVNMNYIPRLSSITLWSVIVPNLCTFISIIPLIIVSLVPINIFKKYRRVWYIISTILASILCPAVPLIQISCTLVLCGMYEITLLYLCITYTRV